MNRKTLVIAISIIAACAGIYFWAEWQKQAFDASLPKVPVQEQATQVSQQETGGHWHGDEWHEEPHEIETPDTGPYLYPITLPKLSDIKPGEIRYYDEAKTRPIHWDEYGGIVPDENTPRPFKHLTNEKFHTMDRTGLTPEEQVLLRNELYFRYPESRQRLKTSQQLWKKMEERDRLNEQRNARAIQQHEQQQREREQQQEVNQ